MDFNQIRFFLALADTLNFTRAAERCFVTQPALTQGIKRLENELDGKLINRDGRHNELTELGRSLHDHFLQLERTRHLVKMTAKAATEIDMIELNIGVMCTVGPTVLTGMLHKFQKDSPKISIILHDVTPMAVTDLLLTGSLDAIFCARHSPNHPRLEYINLFEEPMVVAFAEGHEFIKKSSVSLSDISKHPYVERLHCEFRTKTAEFSLDNNLNFNIIFSSEREDWIQCLIKDGVGVSIIPLYSIFKTELAHRPISEPLMLRKVELAIAKNNVIAPALEKLIHHANQYDWPS